MRHILNTKNIIKHVTARQILDSRGLPTVACDLHVQNAVFTACVPSGASTGKYEAVELRDGDKVKYHGKGVLKAVQNVTKILQVVKGMDVTKQAQIDLAMIKLDGTPNKANLGANAILAVSMAVSRAAASHKGQYLWQYLSQLSKNKPSLPYPYLNVINGGKHADNLLACQQFMICPQKQKTFADTMRVGCQIYQNLKKIIKKKYKSTGVGDQGGFAPNCNNAEQALDLVSQACKQYKDVKIALDVAASEFFDQKALNYNLNFKGQKANSLSKKDLVQYYIGLTKKYPIKSIQDPFDQDDFDSYQEIMKQKDSHLQIVGDDLLVTNITRIAMAYQKKLVNALLLKVNQIGTITESLQAAQMCKKQGWGIMVSHRSGQTEDDYIADLVVGLGAGQIKTGAPCRSERLSKYNRLMKIEEEMKQLKVDSQFPPSK